ncbi:hypothetical protein TD95_000223 [Thielaviopsis punctulata]|uniref:Uncharacterized protein n=1 Tax=Thielaviopsis punctulata TaxID=72032 RepID=A0A0F4ZEP5_9PEZI|nr:hypothetical protein TD95_000223 [Thielaviopsis punctulata]
MAEEPSAAAISEVQEFTSFFDQATIGRALKVVQEYFEDPEQFKTKYSWDDNAFGADREGNTQQGSAPQGGAFENNNTPGTSGGEPYYDRLALSRPPSRTGNPSPMDRVAEWRTGTMGVSQEDEDLQKALRLSAQESGVEIDPQEMGVINSVTPQLLQVGESQGDGSAPPPVVFGPARREEYPETNWAMVPSNSHQPSYLSGIDGIKPQHRRRPYDAPATLVLVDKQGRISSMDRLGGIISVLHSIPLARNILLGGPQNSAYGHNQDWWKGTPILGVSQDVQPEATTDGNTDAMDWAVNQPSIFLNDEIHRLVSMLDMSERSFGTINVLAEAMGGTYSLEQRFFEHIIGRDREAAGPLVTTVRRELMGASAQAEDSDDEKDNRAEVTFIEADISSENWPYVTSFTDIWDHIMWRDSVAYTKHPHATSQMMTIEKQGEVLVMQINTRNMANVIDVPREFSIERYMQDRKEEAIGIVQMLTDQKICLAKAEERLKKISVVHDDSSGTDKPALDEYMAKIQNYQNQRRYLHERARFRTFSDSGFDENKYPRGAEDAPVDLSEQEEQLVAKLDALIASLQEKRTLASSEIKSKQPPSLSHKTGPPLTQTNPDLEKHIAFHKEKLRQLSTMFSDPEKPRPKPFTSRLMRLRGIVCENGITYICQRQEQKLIDLGDDEAVQPTDQWWRLSVSPYNGPAVDAKKVQWDDFCETFFHEGYDPVLVYATEDALNATPLPLTDALTKFVRLDNRLFHQELSRNYDDETPGLPETNPGDPMARSSPIRSPSGKRKHRSGSPDSMASHRASNSTRSEYNSSAPAVLPAAHAPSADVAMAWSVGSAAPPAYQDLAGMDPGSLLGDVKMEPPSYSETAVNPAFTQRELVVQDVTVHEIEVHSDEDAAATSASAPVRHGDKETAQAEDVPPPLPERKPQM